MMKKYHLKIKTSVLAIVILIAMAFAVQTQAQDPEFEKQVDQLVQPYLDNNKVQSVSLAIVRKGKVWTKGYGQLSKDDKTKPDGDTIFEIGSISKVFTSLLLADAINRDQLKLDQPLGSLIDGLDAENEVVSKITLKQLSTHMSGLPRMPANITPADPNNPFADYDRKLLLEYCKQVAVEDAPGATNEYSNLGAGLLGDLIATKSNQSFEALLKDRICKPLSMNDTTVTVTGDALKRFAPPFNAAMLPDHRWDFDALAGAGAIRSSVNDMAKFMLACINPPAGEAGEAIKLAWEKQLDAGEDYRAMGLGWMIAGDGSTRYHNGQTGGYHSMMLVSKKLDAGVILLANTAEMELDGLAEQIFQATVGMNPEPREFKDVVKVDDAVLQRLVGNYQLAPGAVLTVTANEGKMMIQLTGQQALEVVPESDKVWNVKLVEAQLTFDLRNTGPAKKVTLDQNGRKMPAPRIKE